MASTTLHPPPSLREPSGSTDSIDRLPDEMNDMEIRDEKDVEATVINGNRTETGHIIVTTIGGRNEQQLTTISYMAERIVGQGSFGAVFQTISYMAKCIVGQGSFGIVFQGKCLETGESGAINKVLQDKRCKNLELQTMRLLDHSNVVALKHCFFSTTDTNELYLNLMQEYLPETVHRVIKHYNKMNQRMPIIYVKLYTYQMVRALPYIHGVIGVCHRDIKPQNVLVKREPNISYICSRYYRAPELIFGATEYTTAINIWSAGSVMAELLLGQRLFPGESGVDPLVEIIKEYSKMSNDLGDKEVTLKDVANLKNTVITKTTVSMSYKEENLFEKIPKDILFNILVGIPARYIHKNARPVCKEWRELTSSSDFINKNTTKTKTKFLVQWLSKNYCNEIKVMDVSEDGLDFELHDPEPGLRKRYIIRASCNGLILVSDHRKQKRNGYTKPSLMVMNLARKKKIPLPSCSFECYHDKCRMNLGFDFFIKKYKVIHMMADLSGFEIIVLGLRYSVWRHVYVPWNDPSELPFVLDFNWSKEMFVKVPAPPFSGYKLQFPGHLSLVHYISDIQIDIWFWNGTTWFIKHSIRAESIDITNFDDRIPDLRKLIPIGNAREGKVLIFKHVRFEPWIYLYDTEKKRMKKFKMTTKNLFNPIPHKSTLVSWKTENNSQNKL